MQKVAQAGLSLILLRELALFFSVGAITPFVTVHDVIMTSGKRDLLLR